MTQPTPPGLFLRFFDGDDGRYISAADLAIWLSGYAEYLRAKDQLAMAAGVASVGNMLVEQLELGAPR